MPHSKPYRLLVCTVLALLSPLCLSQPFSSSPKNTTLRLTSPSDGAHVVVPITVEFQLRGMMLMPAGVAHSDAGHLHLIVNGEGQPEAGDDVRIASKHWRFQQNHALDKGERRLTVTLPPGQHRLQAVLADHLHRIHQPPVLSPEITVTVVAPENPKAAGPATP